MENIDKKTTKKSNEKIDTLSSSATKLPNKNTKTAKKFNTDSKEAPGNTSINSKTKKHVLFVCSEAQPFVGTGGLSDVMGSLPQAINAKNSGVEVRVVLPLYDMMNQEYKQKLEFICSINVPVAWRNQYCGLFKLSYEGVTYYFLDNEYYFKRQNIYGYYDDGERFAFLSRAALEIIEKLDWRIDILHCHDWHTALVQIYYKLFYQYRYGYEGIKTIYTIHNIEYQGKYDCAIIEDVLGIPLNQCGSIEYDGNINLIKGAIDYSDIVTTVSPTYATELCDPYYAYGLEKIIQKNKDKISGILNGIDMNVNNPETSKSLFQNYNADSLQKKSINKNELQKMIGLPVSTDTPLIAVVSRLVPHKGLELLKHSLNNLLNHDMQLVVLGTGMPALEEYFSHIQVEYNTKVSTIIAYNKDLSQKIYAGADIFLMPSKSEPCGLSQMIAMRYGTIPVVRSTGGLKDTVIDYSDSNGNGFVFHDFNVFELSRAIDRAIDLFRNNKTEWTKLIKKAMSMDYSWAKSAEDYIKLYI